MFTIAMILASFVPPTAPPTLTDVIVTTGCAQNRNPDRAMVDEILRLEEAAGVPDVARGITAAVACRESGFNPDALGDWRIKAGVPCAEGDPKPCRAKAVGLYQFWPWARVKMRRLYDVQRDPRRDWRLSTAFWVQHVAAQVPRVREVCGYSDELDVWKAAHRTAITFPLCVKRRAGRCIKRAPRCHKVGQHSSRHWAIRDGWIRRVSPIRVVLSSRP